MECEAPGSTLNKVVRHCEIKIEDIAIPQQRRLIDQRTVDILADSIAEIGLLNPIIVRQKLLRRNQNTVTLVAGLHRLVAAKQLGWTVIESRIVSDDDLEAELMEIDENLCRAELTPAEEAAAMVRRKEIYVALHPDTAQGMAQDACMNRKLRRGNVSEESAPTFAEATSAISGKSRRSVEMAVARGQAIGPENLAKIRKTRLNKRSEFDALKKLPQEKQRELIERAAHGEEVSARAELVSAGSSSSSAQKILPSQRESRQTNFANLRRHGTKRATMFVWPSVSRS